MMGFGGFSYGMGMAGWIFPIIFVFGSFYLISYLVRSQTHKNNLSDDSSNAREIASQRYARGEITEEEYKRIRDNL